MNKGRIVQVMGPVVDVVFENGDLPFIKDALEVENNGKKCIMEVAQHLGNNEVRRHWADCSMYSVRQSTMASRSLIQKNGSSTESHQHLKSKVRL